MNHRYRRARSHFLPLAIIGLVCALLMAGCTLGEDKAAEGSIRQLDGSTTKWRNCANRADDILGGKPGGVTFACATLRVPQDWSNPSGPSFSVALLRMRNNSQKNRLGSLVINPGGPGASGTELAVQSALFLPRQIQRRYDIIGFDPRGVGGSSPVRCVSDEEKNQHPTPDPDPNSAEFDAQVAEARTVAQACERKYGDKLGAYSTEQTARDMDAIRAAVGDAKLNYLGFSYGTLLGSVYAQLFPNTVGSMVLDGPVDPTQNSVAATELQTKGFEKAFDAFAAACKERGQSCPLGPDARASTERILRKVQLTPVVAGDGRVAGDGVVAFAAIAALYSSQEWETLETALSDVDNGKAEGVFDLVDRYNGRKENGSYDNSMEAGLAIGCADEATPLSVDQVRTLESQWRTKYPLFGSIVALSLLGCSEWKTAHHPYPKNQATGIPPVLIVGTTGDPATPYENTAKLAGLLAGSVVLTVEGEGHTSYPQNDCVTNAVNTFLLDNQLPEANKRCV